ncbi:MAG: CvpA family protein [Bacilli bacterium]|nr:CvpA family protein [Bacilli bacterium]
MSLVDILIVIFIILGGLSGFKNGFTKSVVKFLGVLVVLILAFILKNPISLFLMSVGPFIPFGGMIKGVTILNILLYEVISFSVVFSVLMIVLKILTKTTSIFEKILNFTIILGIPSKILGLLFGILKNYVIVFFVMYFLAMPNFSDVTFVNDSTLKDPILRNTPILSSIADKSVKVLDEFKDLSKKYKNSKDANEFNLETLDLFLKYDVTDVATVKNLRDSGKLKIKGIDEVLNKYEN